MSVPVPDASGSGLAIGVDFGWAVRGTGCPSRSGPGTPCTARRGCTAAGPVAGESADASAGDRLVRLRILRPNHANGVVRGVDHPLLQRDDGVVGDLDVLGAHLGAALGDVALAQALLLLQELAAVVDVERVHLELGRAGEEARAGEGGLVLLVVADDVAHVLAQVALDALAELLAPLDVDLLHAVAAGLLLVGRLGPGLNGGIRLATS